MPIRVSGKARKEDAIRVSIHGVTATVRAQQAGNWHVELPPLAAGGPYRLEVTSSSGEQVVAGDVHIGEVWFCSGQSNMEWPVARSSHPELAAQADPGKTVRLFKIPRNSSLLPENQPEEARWRRNERGAVEGFSAVAYGYGLRLHRELGVAIGLIDASWGGTRAEAWIPRTALANHGLLRRLVEDFETQQTKLGIPAAKLPALYARCKALGASAPPDPEWQKMAPLWPQRIPGGLYNAMVHPIIGHPVRGVLWYQGEANANSGRGFEYRHLLKLLIQSWRAAWDHPEMPFLICQLPHYRERPSRPVPSSWAMTRESQVWVESEKDVFTGCLIDLGEAKDIHPRDKESVAARLAHLALGRVYGHEKGPWEGPRFSRIAWEGPIARVYFRGLDGGRLRCQGERVEGFSIAGKDRIFHWAEAVNEGQTVRVSHPAVTEPAAVRYGWADNPGCNLFGETMLPVMPFRTDRWPEGDQTET